MRACSECGRETRVFYRDPRDEGFRTTLCHECWERIDAELMADIPFSTFSSRTAAVGADFWLVLDPFVGFVDPAHEVDGWFLLHDSCHGDYLDGRYPEQSPDVLHGGAEPDADWAVVDGRIDDSGDTPDEETRDALRALLDGRAACALCRRPVGRTASRVASRGPNLYNHFPTAVDPGIDGYDHRCLICGAKPYEHAWHPGVDAQFEEPEDDAERDDAREIISEREELMTPDEIRSFLESEGALSASEVEAVLAELVGDRTASAPGPDTCPDCGSTEVRSELTPTGSTATVCHACGCSHETARTASPVRYVAPEMRATTAVAGEGAYATDPHDSSRRVECAPGTLARAVAAYKSFGGRVVHDWEIDGQPGQWTLGGEWEVGSDPDWSLHATWDAENRRWVHSARVRVVEWDGDVPAGVEAEARALAEESGRIAYAVVDEAGAWKAVPSSYVPVEGDVAYREYHAASWPHHDPDCPSCRTSAAGPTCPTCGSPDVMEFAESEDDFHAECRSCGEMFSVKRSRTAAGSPPVGQGEGPEWFPASVLVIHGERYDAWTDGTRVALNRDDLEDLVEYLDEDGYYTFRLEWYGRDAELWTSNGGDDLEAVDLRRLAFGPTDQDHWVLPDGLSGAVTLIEARA